MLETYGLSKAQILQALYDRARVQGMGFLHAIPGPLPVEEADALVKEFNYVDYLHGRVIKMSLTELNPALYDRDNGPGAAQKAIDDFYCLL